MVQLTRRGVDAPHLDDKLVRAVHVAQVGHPATVQLVSHRATSHQSRGFDARAIDEDLLYVRVRELGIDTVSSGLPKRDHPGEMDD